MSESIILDIMEKEDVDDCDAKPICGMEFDSEETTYQFYNEYGRKMGFSVRKDNINRNKRTGEATSRVFVCSKEGFRAKDKRDSMIKNPRAETRIGCDAQMVIRFNKSNGKCFVNHFVEKHNHSLVKPECAHMLPSQRNIHELNATQIDLADESGISLSSAYELMGRQIGGRDCLGYTKVDQKNYLRSKRQSKMAYGEAGSLLRYFQNQTLENPSSFYVVQLDNEEQITNIFWADARMIIDYGNFSDVVSFDTTYKVNKANRPFGVFVGFNHHRETIVFGAALMYDETADSFIWLFESFLETMSKKAPKTIFTYQDPGMAKAIAFVMPDTYHRLCTRHIRHNALRHANKLFKGDKWAKNILSKFMEEYEEEDEFLAVWDSMLEEYQMHDNTWLKIMYNLREKWGLTYVKRAWSAGMKNTQVSESFNGSIKNYLNSDHDVLQFFMHFERVLNDKRYKEHQAEYDLCYKNARIRIPAMMVRQAGDIYTRAILEDFQHQYGRFLDVQIKSTIDHGEDIVYTLSSPYGKRERQVRRKRDSDNISCNCRLFEMKCILCRHAIKILREVVNVLEIPNQYILKRWTQKARVETVEDMHGREIQLGTKLQQNSWYKSLCHTYIRILLRASESKETYKTALSNAQSLGTLIEDMLALQIDNQVEDKDGDSSPTVNVKKANATRPDNRNIVQAKGLKHREKTRGRKRFKSGVEVALDAKKRSSSSHLSKDLSKRRRKDVVHDTGIHEDTHASAAYIPSPLIPSQSSQIMYDNPQCTNIQELLQANSVAYTFACQDLEAPNNNFHSQGLDLNVALDWNETRESLNVIK